MTIDRVGSVNPIPSAKKAEWNNQVNRPVQTDSIDLSADAVRKSELLRAHDIVFAAPDIREDRIAELKQKINDPSYINDTLLQGTADKIMEAFGL
jgi:negative regulator of flagellin synthesis FlgM